jgi:hypothetical protein
MHYSASSNTLETIAPSPEKWTLMMSVSATYLDWAAVMQILIIIQSGNKPLNLLYSMQNTKNGIIKIEPPEKTLKGKLAPLRQSIITKNKPTNHTEARDEYASRKIFKRLEDPLP